MRYAVWTDRVGPCRRRREALTPLCSDRELTAHRRCTRSVRRNIHGLLAGAGGEHCPGVARSGNGRRHSFGRRGGRYCCASVTAGANKKSARCEKDCRQKQNSILCLAYGKNAIAPSGHSESTVSPSDGKHCQVIRCSDCITLPCQSSMPTHRLIPFICCDVFFGEKQYRFRQGLARVEVFVTKSAPTVARVRAIGTATAQ